MPFLVAVGRAEVSVALMTTESSAGAIRAPNATATRLPNGHWGPRKSADLWGRAEALRTSMSLERSRKTQSVSEGAERDARTQHR